jgi:hypothetical protein
MRASSSTATTCDSSFTLALLRTCAFGFGLGQLLFVYTVWRCLHSGTPAPAKPWEGAERRTDSTSSTLHFEVLYRCHRDATHLL